MKTETHFAYLIELNDYRTNRRRYLKCGYTNNICRRMDELEYKYDCIANILTFYKFNKKETALMMEDVMRMYYKEKKNSHYIRQDRFQRVFPETADYQYFDKEALHLAKRYDN